MGIAMSADTDAAGIPMPQLSDDAVVQIHDFIGHFLDLFEARYGDQIHRYYEDHSAHDMLRTDTLPGTDDPPF